MRLPQASKWWLAQIERGCAGLSPQPPFGVNVQADPQTHAQQVRLIQSQAELDRLLQQLSQEPLLAVDTEAGLLVPVIRNADKKSILDLSKDVAAFAEKARDRKVSLEEMQGGTFTISNQGGIGGAHFTPVINKPEVAILGLGRGVMKPVVRDGKIEPRLMMPIAIAYDHRVIDGGEAARFCVELVKAFDEIAAGLEMVARPD